MAKCAYCGSYILFNGIRDDDLRFCNLKCHRQGYALMIAKEMPKDIVDKYVKEVHDGSCPKCQGNGPVDVHMSYRIYSLLLYTSWSSKPNIVCRSCGVKIQISDAIFSFLFGWWGFPWGLVMTPMQVFRNIFYMMSPPDESKPSEKLRNILRLTTAANLHKKL